MCSGSRGCFRICCACLISAQFPLFQYFSLLRLPNESFILFEEAIRPHVRELWLWKIRIRLAALKYCFGCVPFASAV
ncbi:uncharacterized protein BO96DRAFT_23377 [Aspergillus niger CBS 101883]|uniref:uncharacterized protein n=1 Tax=Aspergillus lacticoffeatus (strain CBS 101883) TaxID=1450533 RepID=UPI000D801FBD|nr:uncharacterized protein BO96DRAFT_23377 [Aspergillus niger CBS 101883]PYH62823.1 hypothetical protein BO96DRAFT_23377 [Aspergillus niger CBS 101883]